MSKIDALIVFDSDHPGALQNKCFDESYRTTGSGHAFTVELGLQARQRGYKIVTSDVYLGLDTNPIAYCITDMVSSNTNDVLSKGAVPLYCICMESPLIARKYYRNIEKLAGRFHYSIQFRGTFSRLDKTATEFSTMYYPVEKRLPLPYLDWNSRKLLTMVSRNKRIFYSKSNSFFDFIRSRISRVKLEFDKILDPWLKSRELYRDRIEVMRFFSDKKLLDLYGHGWNDRIPGYSKEFWYSAMNAYKGEIPTMDKLSVLNSYKFSICFENCEFPGYVTEKIFDCFLAGTIPIYFGAPDIAEFVPENTFIDYRRFNDLSQLSDFIESFSEKDAMEMLNSINEYLASEAFDKYYLPNIINSILEGVESYQELK